MKYRISGTDPAQFNELLSTLSPANDILHTIQFDHLYTSRSQPSETSPRSVHHTVRFSNALPHNQKAAAAIKPEHHSETDVDSLNAESIQRVFQNMLNMTALTDIADLAEPLSFESDGESKPSSASPSVADTANSKTNKIHTIKLVNNIPNPSPSKEVDMSHLKASNMKNNHGNVNNNVKKSGSSSNSEVTRVKRKKGGEKQSSTECDANGSSLSTTKVGEDEWKTVTRCIQAEREMNTLLKYTAKLLVKRWGEYLTMSMDEVREFEVKNARELGMVEEVVDMLEDKNRYVWQLIEQLQFE